MSKLAHSDDVGMKLIDMRRWFKNEATEWHKSAISSALKLGIIRAESDGALTLCQELVDAGFFRSMKESQAFSLTKPGHQLAVEH